RNGDCADNHDNCGFRPIRTCVPRPEHRRVRYRSIRSPPAAAAAQIAPICKPVEEFVCHARTSVGRMAAGKRQDRAPSYRERNPAMADKPDPHAPLPLGQALEDHSAEGAEILYSEPSPLIRRSIWLMALLLVTAVAWSIIGKVDVVVSAPGVLRPEQE